MTDLKGKTIKGIIWSFIENLVNLGISFFIGLILARLLSPKDFGLIGMVTIFTAVSATFINSGFSQALIKKKVCSDVDYSTVFYFNFFVGIVLYLILFYLSPYIAEYFGEYKLINIVRVLSFVLVIESLTIIQRTLLTKKIDFKLQTKITIISSILSGTIAIGLAFRGYGVWSLVLKTLIQEGVNSVLLWYYNRWKPLFVFSIKSFNELFSFGSKLLISALIGTIYQNIYYLIIGKYFSAQELGYFTRAQQFKDLPSSNINGVVSRVSYPVLAEIQDDKERLKSGYKKIIKLTMYITFILMLGMAAVAEPMIISLIGEKWSTSIVYLQMLCFVGMFYPLHSLNLNILNVLGRSDLFLKLEIIKKVIAIPTIILGVFFGIKVMILGMMFNTLVAYYLNSFWSGKFINYPIKEQILDILPSFLLALSVSLILYILGILLPFEPVWILLLLMCTGFILVVVFSSVFKLEAYKEIKDIIFSNIKIMNRWNVK